MDSDEVAEDPSGVPAPAAPDAPARAEHHSDDELAVVIEEQVSRITAALPIVAGKTSPRVVPVKSTRAEPLGLVPETLAPRDSQPVPVLSQPEPAAAEMSAERDAPATAETPAAVDEPVGVAEPAAVSEPVTSAEPAAPAPPIAAVFRIEETDLEPVPLASRRGRATRMFWLWFSATSSLVSVGVGGTLFTLGLSLRQALVAALVGVGLSFLPLGLGTLAGKWSGQPTMVVSRATFGLRGNAIAAALALLTRLFWGAVMVWLAGSAVGTLATTLGWPGEPVPAMAAGIVLVLAIAGVVAYFGYPLVARLQLILTIASAATIVVMIITTWRFVNFSRALDVPDGAWPRVVTGAVLVFSYLGLAWASSSAEVARYQRRRSSGAAAMLWATFGAGLPPLILISFGGLLAASDPAMADGLADDPVRALFGLGLPGWLSLPLLLAVLGGLVSGLVLTLYSGGFTLDALGASLGRRRSTVVVGIAVGLAGAALTAASSDLSVIVRGVPTLLAVPVAAWAGLFSAEMMMRLRRFHASSLLRRGGVYADWRWTNVTMLVVASAIGFGLVTSDVPWLRWEGFLFPLLRVDPHGDLAMADLGVIVALVLGVLTPLATGIREVRRQETTMPEAAPLAAQ